MSEIKMNPGARALLHFYARCNDQDYVSPERDEWCGYVHEVLEAEVLAVRDHLGRERADCVGATFSDADRGMFVFSFGAYGDHHVIACGSLEDALEEAAGTLKPGYFTEPELPDDYEAMSEEEQDEAYNEATADLTYTESGYLCSYEWFVNELRSPEDLFDWLYA